MSLFVGEEYIQLVLFCWKRKFHELYSLYRELPAPRAFYKSSWEANRIWDPKHGSKNPSENSVWSKTFPRSIPCAESWRLHMEGKCLCAGGQQKRSWPASCCWSEVCAQGPLYESCAFSKCLAHQLKKKLVDWLQYLYGLSVYLYNFSQVDTVKTVNCRAY